MKVRITCDKCSGELELPKVPAGTEIRCPQCGEILISTIAAAPKPAMKRGPEPRRPTKPTRWSPHPDDDDDDGIPWFIWLTVFAPAAMLWFVAIEPIACGIAGGLVILSIVVAMRSSWPRWSRVMGILSLVMLGMGAAVVANLYAEGNFAKFRLASVFPTTGSLDVGKIVWEPLSSKDENFRVDFPGIPVRSEIKERGRIEIAVYETKYRQQNVTFAVHVLKLPIARFDEATETEWLKRLDDDEIRWLFHPGVVERERKIFHAYEHSGKEFHFAVGELDKSQKQVTPTMLITARTYLVRDRAYVLSVSRPPDKSDEVAPIADKFFGSFKLLQPTPGFNRAAPDEPDVTLKRFPSATPLASFRGHFKCTPKPPLITLLAFSADGKSLFSGAIHEHVVQWDVTTGDGDVVQEVAFYNAFTIHPSGRGFVFQTPGPSGLPDDYKWYEEKKKLPALGRTNVDLIAFPGTPAGNRTAVVALDDRLIGVVDISRKPIVHLWPSVSVSPPTFWPWQQSPLEITSLALTNDGRLAAASCYESPTITLRDVSNGCAELANWTAHDLAPRDAPRKVPIQQLDFTPDGKRLASAGLDYSVKIWNVADARKPKLLATLRHDAPVACLDYSTDGKRLATGDFSGIVRIYDAATNELTHEFRATAGKQQVQLLRFSPDGTRLAAGVALSEERAGVNLYDVDSLPAVAESGKTAGPKTEPPKTELPKTQPPPRVTEDEPPTFKDVPKK